MLKTHPEYQRVDHYKIINKTIISRNWFLELMDEMYYGKHNLIFNAPPDVHYITVDMWNTLSNYVKSNNVKIEYCIFTFYKSNLKSFTIPDWCDHIFENLVSCDGMFSESYVEHVDVTFKSQVLIGVKNMFARSREMKHLNITFRSNMLQFDASGIVLCCSELKTLIISFSCRRLQFICACSYCDSLTSAKLTFVNPCSIMNFTNSFNDNSELKWFRIIGSVKPSHIFRMNYSGNNKLIWEPFGCKLQGHKYNSEKTKLKYCHSYVTNSYSFNSHIVHFINYQPELMVVHRSLII